MANWIRTALVSAITLVGFATGTMAAEPVSMRADHWCPYNCAPEDGKPGYMVEVIRNILARENIELDYGLLDWTEALDAVRTGKVMGAVGANRRETPDFIFPKEPLGLSGTVLVQRRGGNWKYDGTASLAAIKIGAVKSYSYDAAIDGHIATHAKAGKVVLLSGDNVSGQLVTKLLSGEIDAFVEDANVADYLVLSGGYESVVDIIPIGEKTEVSIALAPKNPRSQEIADLLDKGIAEMRANGQLGKILKRYGMRDWQ